LVPDEWQPVSVTVRIAERDYAQLESHLFQPDQDEHGAALLAGVRQTENGLSLFVREVIPAEGADFGPGVQGYRQFSPRFIAETAGRAGAEGLAYLTAHSHPGADRANRLSGPDLAAHQRLFPHLLDLTAGSPVAGLAFGRASVAGEVWRQGANPVELDFVDVVGPRLRRLAPDPPFGADAPHRYERQVRLLGGEIQTLLGEMKVGVVGAGGGGSMIIEQLAHLGIGEIAAIDFDQVEETNLSRIVGARSADARRGLKKVEVARRLVRSINPSINFVPIDGDIADAAVAEELLDLDFIFLATDTITSRLVFNAAVHRFLVPGIQIGAKVELGTKQQIEQIYVAVRPVFPDRGCLACASLISPERLQAEVRTPEEAKAQNYLNTPEVIDPAVISLNGIAASYAVNSMLLGLTHLASESSFDHRLFFLDQGNVMAVDASADPQCPWCSRSRNSAFAQGGTARDLPCRLGPAPVSTKAQFAWVRRFFGSAKS
jgi:molybdopterin/thiamine biosynthesis adenylyltransferase